MEIDF